MSKIQDVKVSSIAELPGNRKFSAEGLKELADSIRATGLLQPIVVRLVDDGGYDLVAGARRLAAFKAMGKESIPAIVRTMTDTALLTARIVENDQREDVHPLDQALGYQALTRLKPPLSAAEISKATGRSFNFVYDRMRLLEMVPDGQKLFREGVFGIGQAVLLARLPKDRQKEALDPRNAALLESEDDVRLHLEDDDPPRLVRPRTVLQFQSWIDRHVRFDPEAKDVPTLFPETAIAVAKATAIEKAPAPVSITDDPFVSPDARDDDERTFGPRSWKEATGRDKHSKTCEKSRLGVFVVGARRGQTLQVCVSKVCKVHWPEKRKQKSASGREGLASQRAQKLAEADRQRQEARDAARKVWTASTPDLVKAIATAIETAPTKTLVAFLVGNINGWGAARDVSKLMKAARDPESYVRLVAAMDVAASCDQYTSNESFPKLVKKLGLKIDVAGIVKKHAPTKETKPKSAA
jgi:ParB/RepB/Spo0J family partition protein